MKYETNAYTINSPTSALTRQDTFRRRIRKKENRRGDDYQDGITRRQGMWVVKVMEWVSKGIAKPVLQGESQ